MLGEFTEWKELWFHQHPAQEAEARDIPITLCQSLPQLPQFLWAPHYPEEDTQKSWVSGDWEEANSVLYTHLYHALKCTDLLSSDTWLLHCRQSADLAQINTAQVQSNSVPHGYLVDSSNSLRVRSNHSLEKLITFLFRDCYWFSLWRITHITILDNISFSSLTS